MLYSIPAILPPNLLENVLIVFSMSLLGWVSLLSLFLIWFFTSIKNRKRIITMLFVVAVLPIILLILYNTALIQNVISDKFLEQSVTSDERFAGVSAVKNIIANGGFTSIFGNGLITTDTYYNGVTRIVISFGLLGLLIATYVFILCFRKYKNNVLSKALLLLLLILSFGSEIIFVKYILTYLSFLQIHSKHKIEPLTTKCF